MKHPPLFEIGFHTMNEAVVNVRQWVRAAFGRVLKNPMALHERGLRVVEEAIELGQALGVNEWQVNALRVRVYAKPADAAEKELAQCFITLLAAAGGLGCNPLNVVNAEWARIQDLGPEYFTERMRRKVELGLAAESEAYDGKASTDDNVAPGPLGTIKEAVGGVKPFRFTFGPGVLYERASDETLWETAQAAAVSLTRQIASLRERGYQVELQVAAPGHSHSRTIALHGADPTPVGQIVVIFDPSAVVMKSAQKTVTQGFTNA